MSKHAPDDRLSKFQARLDRLKEEHSDRAGPVAGGRTAGYSMAFAIAADLVGGLAGGAALGWLVDQWLGSAPFGLIAFFFLGALGGMWNVYRTVRGYDMSFGLRRPERRSAEVGDQAKTPAGARPEEESGDHRG